MEEDAHAERFTEEDAERKWDKALDAPPREEIWHWRGHHCCCRHAAEDSGNPWQNGTISPWSPMPR